MVLQYRIQSPVIARQRQFALSPKFAFPVLHVLRDVDDYRPWTPGAGEFKCAAHRRLEFRRIGNKKYVFCYGAHDGRDRGLLKRISTDCGGRYLATDYDDRYRVGHAIANGCDSVRRAGTGGNHYDADLAAGPGIA